MRPYRATLQSSAATQTHDSLSKWHARLNPTVPDLRSPLKSGSSQAGNNSASNPSFTRDARRQVSPATKSLSYLNNPKNALRPSRNGTSNDVCGKRQKSNFMIPSMFSWTFSISTEDLNENLKRCSSFWPTEFFDFRSQTSLSITPFCFSGSS